MPRRKSMSSIETEISALKEKSAAAKKRYKNLCLELEKRQEQRNLILAQEVAQALRTSGKTYRELMTFRQAP